MATYKAVMKSALEYASSIWSPLASSTSIDKLQVMQNAALRTATGCTQDTNIQHLHDETLTLPIHEHLQLHASQYKQKTQHSLHPYYAHLHHTLAALKRDFPALIVAPLPNSEQINLPSSNHTYTKSTQITSITTIPPLQHPHTISSTAPTYAPQCHPWICGQTPLE